MGGDVRRMGGQRKKPAKKRRWILAAAAVLAILCAAFFIYVSDYYRADEKALAALRSDGAVAVVRTDHGYLFDGPSEKDALIFYPGGKVESTAYAPFLHALAEAGVDTFLVDMPFRLAFFGMDRAGGVIEQYDYENWYICGHSLGGVAASSWAAGHPDSLVGVVLLASYPTKAFPASLTELSVYGSEDKVVNTAKIEESRKYAPAGGYDEQVIEGGNHAQFGSYGPQKGDGEAKISAEEQVAETVKIITEHILH